MVELVWLDTRAKNMGKLVCLTQRTWKTLILFYTLKLGEPDLNHWLGTNFMQETKMVLAQSCNEWPLWRTRDSALQLDKISLHQPRRASIPLETDETSFPPSARTCSQARDRKRACKGFRVSSRIGLWVPGSRENLEFDK